MKTIEQKDSRASELSKQIERIKYLKDNPPYKEMLASDNISTRQAAQFAQLGWAGALACVLAILENDLPPTGIKK